MKMIPCSICGKMCYGKSCCRECFEKDKREWVSCQTCGTLFQTYKSNRRRGCGFYCCLACRPPGNHKGKFGNKNSCWRGGQVDLDGYIGILRPDHPHANNGYVYEHRLVFEKFIGRYLTTKETIHHVDHNKQNNDKTNLLYFPHGIWHSHFHLIEKEVGHQEALDWYAKKNFDWG